MKININKIHFPVTTLGFGRRLGIWMQGCSIRCPGCINKDTWDPASKYETSLDELFEVCGRWLDNADGTTVTGGEPFDQPEALLALIRSIRNRNKGDVLVYSGYSRGVLEEHHPNILSTIDVLISEPYRSSANDTLFLRGSDNQRIALLTPLAQRRYPENIDQLPWTQTRRLDLIVTEDEVWFAGIPRSGELQRLKAKLHGLGYRSKTSDVPEMRA